MTQINDEKTFSAVLNNLVGRNDVIKILKTDGDVVTGKVNYFNFGGTIFMRQLLKPSVQIYSITDGLLKDILVDNIKAIYLPD
jgi:hypothetical protein